jgi:transcriptional regulator with XRE-family HTH domain
MKRQIPSEEHKEESYRLQIIWRFRKKISQKEFGKQYELGNQSYIAQCLNGKVILNLKAAIAFAKHLNCLISDFSPRLDDELSEIVNFDMDQKCLRANQKLFNRAKNEY